MCGIAGVLDLLGCGVSSASIEAMNAAQAHRGPDDSGGVLLDAWGNSPARAWGPGEAAPSTPASLGLGHVRLSIIDLSPLAHQPMKSHEGTLWIVYNGEIYNYLELREELRLAGCSFSSSSDTEVLLAAYSAWGDACLPRLNGMWAFAIWDARARRLFCARDRMGVKPFHYHLDDKAFSFSSEIRPLLAGGGTSSAADMTALSDFLIDGTMPHDSATFFAQVRALPGGCSLSIGPGRLPRIVRWWNPEPVSAPVRHGVGTSVRELLADAVRLRLRSDVPLGVCLSGGLDSSAIACILAKQLRHNGSTERVRAFTACFMEEGLDERPFAESVVRRTDAEWSRCWPSAAGLVQDDLQKLVLCQEEPFGSLSIYSQYCVMRNVREQGVTVVLDGQGADELLWGYPWHSAFLLMELFRQRESSRFGRELLRALQVGPAGSISYLAASVVAHAAPGLRRLRNRTRMRGLLPDCALRARGSGAPCRPGRDRAAFWRRQELFADPLPSLLRYEDRNSMAFSVESRLPFLDYRLVELALSIPEEQLIVDGWSKWPLRDGMAGILPDDIRWRKTKVGFAVPGDAWLRALRPLARELFSSRARSASFLRPAAMQGLLQTTRAFPSFVWRAISVELWMRELGVAVS